MTPRERVYLDCPDCGNRYPKPLFRGQVHTRACRSDHGGCRKYVICVDPAGEDHWFEPVGADESYESVSDRIAPRHRQRLERAVLLKVASERAS